MKILHLNLQDIKMDKDSELLLPFVSKRRREKIQRFKFEEDKVLSLYSELLVRMGLAKELGLNHGDLKFGFSEHGKPFCLNSSKMKFNLSHTKMFIIVGFLKDGEVGVDVERLKNPLFDVMDLCFNKNEIDYVNSCETNQKRFFFEVWTKKEAYLKWQGTGIVSDLDEIDTGQFDELFHSYTIDDYICTLCSEDIEGLEVENLTKEDVFGYFLNNESRLGVVA